jgi:hypothetical protein
VTAYQYLTMDDQAMRPDRPWSLNLTTRARWLIIRIVHVGGRQIYNKVVSSRVAQV